MTRDEMTRELAEAIPGLHWNKAHCQAFSYQRVWAPFDSRDDCWMVVEWCRKNRVLRKAVIKLRASYRSHIIQRGIMAATLLFKPADIAAACHAAMVAAGKIPKPKGE